ncbi:hypothetical protein ACP275_03G002100 [Erythranthe tilingii]
MAFLLLLLLLMLLYSSTAQQSYVNNKQLACNNNDTTTLGFVCNGASSTCTSYLTFRSTHTYNSPITIAYLLSADASQIAAANNISDVELLPADTLVIVPVKCSCSQNYYQHNASYILKNQDGTAETETYFTVSNGTYQALTTCQSMESQNPYDYRQLYPGFRLTVPLRCACPTRNQTSSGFNYLLTYLIRQGDNYNSIAAAFSASGADVQGILDANRLSVNDIIFFFTPILVPLKIQPTKAFINTLAAPPPPLPPSNFPPTHNGGSNSRKWIFIGVGIGAAVLFLLSSVLLYLLCYRRRRQSNKSPPPPPKLRADKSGDPTSAGPPFSDWSVSSQSIRSAIETLTVYKFEDLDKATSSFSESNRINGSSSVYLGSFKGDNAVIKIMKGGDVSREINALRQINHSHIIRLSGFCLHHDITYLIYEYAEKGSLTEWLRPNSSLLQKKDSNDKHMNIISITERRLDWKQRLQIAYDVADALNYLHNFTNPPYIHKNLKSSNILLDGNLRAKIADFALSRTLEADDQNLMTRHVVGTYGYMAPEYIESGLITPKLDVFALGVVMLELLSGREPIVDDDDAGKDKNKEGSHQMLLLSERIERVLSGESVREKLKEFVDPWLGDEYPLEVAYSLGELARRCVAHNIDARPNVSDVFVALSKLLSSSLDWDPSHDTSLSFSDRES